MRREAKVMVTQMTTSLVSLTGHAKRDYVLCVFNLREKLFTHRLSLPSTSFLSTLNCRVAEKVKTSDMSDLGDFVWLLGVLSAS